MECICHLCDARLLSFVCVVVLVFSVSPTLLLLSHAHATVWAHVSSVEKRQM